MFVLQKEGKSPYGELAQYISWFEKTISKGNNTIAQDLKTNATAAVMVTPREDGAGELSTLSYSILDHSEYKGRIAT